MFNLNTQKIKYIITGIIIGATFSASIAFADLSEVKLIINGKQIQSDVAPQIINDRVFVPVRLVSENLNCNVRYDADNNSVIIDSDNVDSMLINNNQKENNSVEILKNHKNMSNVYAIKINNNVYLPFQYVIKYYNINFEKYDDLSKIITINGTELKISDNIYNNSDAILYNDKIMIKETFYSD